MLKRDHIIRVEEVVNTDVERGWDIHVAVDGKKEIFHFGALHDGKSNTFHVEYGDKIAVVESARDEEVLSAMNKLLEVS